VRLPCREHTLGRRTGQQSLRRRHARWRPGSAWRFPRCWDFDGFGSIGELFVVIATGQVDRPPRTGHPTAEQDRHGYRGTLAGMAAPDHDAWSPQRVAYARYNLVGYLTEPHRGPRVWVEEIQHGIPMWAPDEAPRDSPEVLGQWLSEQQAARLSKARLCLMDEPAAALAITTGAAIASGAQRSPLAPPAPYGLLVCPTGVGWRLEQAWTYAARTKSTSTGR